MRWPTSTNIVYTPRNLERATRPRHSIPLRSICCASAVAAEQLAAAGTAAAADTGRRAAAAAGPAAGGSQAAGPDSILSGLCTLTLFPAPCYVSPCDRQVLSPAAPGACARSTTRTRCDCVSASCPKSLASSRSPLRPLGWALKGGLLLHFRGLVPGCCTSGPCTESVTAGADGCPSRSGSEDGRVTARHEKKR